MSHQCQALLLHCMDFRFGEAIKKWLEQNRLMNDCDIVSLAGAAKNLASPKEATDAEFVFRQIETSLRLHGISQVILMNHTDCGAYGGRGAFESSQHENNQLIQDMRKAGGMIFNRFPLLKVKMVLARITPLGKISFEDVK